MNTADRPVWFLGDLDDPWVASTADALPAGTRRLNCAGDLPEDWKSAIGTTAVPRTLVLHRTFLSPCDADRIEGLRSQGAPSTRVILCLGPQIRHADLERWSARGIIDGAVPEATARDTIARHVDPVEGDFVTRRPSGPRPGVAVVGTNVELRSTLVDAVEMLGYPAIPSREWSDAPPPGPAIWDVPVLEPDWPLALARRSRLGPVVVLLGFADRGVVTLARAHGASACLELPYDLLDLGHVLDRLAVTRGEPGHTVPPPPSSRRRVGAATTPRGRTGPR